MTQYDSSVVHDSHENYQHILLEIARERLGAFMATIRPDGTYASRVFCSVKSLAEQIRQDYGHRFLIELIQNGYDAHEGSTRAGEVSVYLSVDEGEHGVLYVADKGSGFTRENVEALCDIGLSDKPIGQAVGNKGLGFRSIMSISDNPQIYSKSPISRTTSFDGFCFRFADPADFDHLLETDIHRKLAKQDLPMYHIPVPIEVPQENKTLHSFYEASFSTVICLPIRNKHAVEVVIAAVKELHDSSAPLLLFLPKLAKLSVEAKGTDIDMKFTLSRNLQVLLWEEMEQASRAEVVDLEEFGRYFVAWRKLPENNVKSAIDRSIEEQELHESWSRWHGDGEVAVAFPIEGQDFLPRIFTYFPMGLDAVAPINGYLHGSFYPKSDRTTMRAEIPLNDFVLKEAVKLSISTLHRLRLFEGPLAGNDKETVVGRLIADLMSWQRARGITGEINERFPDLVLKAFEDIGIALCEAAILPRISLSQSSEWASPLEIARWDAHTDLDVLGLAPLVKVARVAILPPSLGKVRIDRLEAFLKEANIREDLSASVEQVASAVELVAQDLHARNVSTDKWAAFYKELVKIIDTDNIHQWYGRAILLCNDGRMRASMSGSHRRTSSRRPSVKKKGRLRKVVGMIAVFFPPRRRQDGSKIEEGRVLKVPRSLKQWFAFLDERLDWFGELEPARSIMERAGLVRPYDSEELVAHLSGVLADNKTPSVRREALQWVFNLWRASGPNLLRRAHLFVPTIMGRWIPAEEAIFSKGWPPATLGEITHSLIIRARTESEDLRKLERALIASPKSIPFSRGPLGAWAEFLGLLKVRRGLQLLMLDPAPVAMWGSSVSLKSICSKLKLKERAYDYMYQAMDTREPEIKYPGTYYRMKRATPYLLGQEDFDDLDEQSRVLYAELLVECLPDMQTMDLRLELVSDSFRYAGKAIWPSPAFGFVTQARWFPMEARDSSTRLEFMRPRDILIEGNFGDRLPPFLPRPSRNLRTRLDRSTTKEALVEVAGALYFGNPSSLIDQIQMLVADFRDGYIQPNQQNQFENLYWETWRQIIANQSAQEWKWRDNTQSLLVRNQGTLVHLSLSELKNEQTEGNTHLERVYVRNDDSGLAATILEDLGYSVIDTGGQRAQKADEFFGSLLGSVSRKTSNVDMHVLVDGKDYQEHTGTEAILKVYPALTHIVSFCMASLTGPAAQRLPRDWGTVLEVLQHIRLVCGKKVELSVEGEILRLPERFFGALAIENSEAPAIVLEVNESEKGWRQLQKASLSLARLLGHSDLDKAFALAFSRLDQLGTPPSEFGSNLPEKELCEILQIDSARKDRAISILTNNTERAVAFFRPIVHYFAGQIGDEQFKHLVVGASTTVEMAKLALQLIDDDVLDEKKILSLLQSCRSPEDIMEELGLDFRKFNASLIALGYDPISYPDRHLNAVKQYISENNDYIMDCIRQPYLATYSAFGDLEPYVTIRRSLTNLQSKSEWLTQVEEPDIPMLQFLLQEWIDLALPSKQTAGREKMPAFSGVHQRNYRAVQETITKAVPLVCAWCHKSSVDAGDWNDSGVVERFTIWLNNSGALDFLLLRPNDIIRWLHTLGIWPVIMPLSISANDLGLTKDDIIWEQRRRKEAREAQARERRSITFNGRWIDPQQISPPALADEIKELLSAEVLKTPLGIFSPIVAPQTARGEPRGKKRPGTDTPPIGRLNQEKADLIGFLGELAVYHWLKQRLPRLNIENSWVSSYRSRFFPGPSDDSLGYDFEIYHQRRRLYLEVKAHLDDPRSFELGETEVIRAQECNRRGGPDYCIVYVSNVAHTPSLHIEILPNPLSDRGKDAYRLEGRGLRYRFNRLA